MRKILIGGFSYAHRLGTEPATQACALNGNQPGDLSLYEDDAQPTESHWSGYRLFASCRSCRILTGGIHFVLDYP